MLDSGVLVQLRQYEAVSYIGGAERTQLMETDKTKANDENFFPPFDRTYVKFWRKNLQIQNWSASTYYLDIDCMM